MNAGWRILIVTDSILDRKLASGLLSKHGHHVTVASDALQASQACETSDLDLVVIDFFLRDLNPGELIRAIRKHAEAKGKTSVILAIAADAHEVASQYRELGMDGFLIKPLTIDQVNTWMERCTCTSQSTEAACLSDTINWAEVLEGLGGRKELLIDLLDVFFQEYPPTLESIREAIDKQNIKQLQLSAHKLKGCLRYFGQSAASEKAQELEHLARSGTMSGAEGRLVELETAMSVLLPKLKAPAI